MSLPLTLFMIETDPRVSHRPAEAIRLAAGIQVWKRTAVEVVFRGMAPLCLQEFHDDLVDEDNFTHYLPMLREAKIPLWVDSDFSERELLAAEVWPFRFIGGVELGGLILSSRNLIRL